MSLHGQDSLFALQAPEIAAQTAVGADDTVAGDQQGYGVGGTGAGHGPAGRRLAEVTGYLPVGFRAAARDGSKRLPDALLEKSCAEVEWQLIGDRMIGELREHGP